MGGGWDKHTKFLLHGHELNTGTDSSIYKVPLENNGAAINKDITRFGRGSLYFNGNSRIFLPYDTFLLGTNKFTIDWWEYPIVGDKGTSFCTCYGPQSAFGGLLLCYRGTEIYASSAANTQWNIINAVEAKQLILNKWTHWAFVRGEGSIFVYKNGVRVKVANMNSPYSIAQDSRFKMVIGDYRPDDHDCFMGCIEEFRISDVARWTGNFTPPTKPYK